GTADVAVLTDRSVTDVGQVRNLATGTDVGGLRFDERSDFPVLPEPRAGTEITERADLGAVVDDRSRTVRANHGRLRADTDVGQCRVRPDVCATADGGVAVQLHSGRDRDVTGQRDPHVHPGGRRILHGDSGVLPLSDHAPVELCGQLGQLDPVVDSRGPPRVVGDERPGPVAVGTGDAEHIGQIELTLCVVAGESVERVVEHVRVEGVYARIDLVVVALFRGRVVLLDNPRDIAVAVANDASVPGGVVEHGGHNRDGVTVSVVLRG